jgi:hypothetical protein
MAKLKLATKGSDQEITKEAERIIKLIFVEDIEPTEKFIIVMPQMEMRFISLISGLYSGEITMPGLPKGTGGARHADIKQFVKLFEPVINTELGELENLENIYDHDLKNGVGYNWYLKLCFDRIENTYFRDLRKPANEIYQWYLNGEKAGNYLDRLAKMDPILEKLETWVNNQKNVSNSIVQDRDIDKELDFILNWKKYI